MTLSEAGSLLLCVLLVTSFGLWRFMRAAAFLGLMDTPNDRSQHTVETPVGAGFVSAVTFSLALWLLVPGLEGTLWPPHWLALLLIIMAVIGLLDDRFDLPSGPRLIAYGVACALLIYGGLPAINPGNALVLILLFTWHVNAYNFMDGADGLATTQALVVASGMGIVGWYTGLASPALLWMCALLVTVVFPLWVINWPPAKVFMGDSGAISIAVVLAIIAIAALRESPVLFAVWCILMAPFLADATSTLFIRLLQGKAPHIAHRDHAYQRLLRRTGSAFAVNVGLLLMHLVWQFPLVVVTVMNADSNWIPVILAPIPMLAVVAHLQRSTYTATR